MKYAITGHTQGIGKCLYDRLSPNILGFSKSTGYNINNKFDREKIIEEIKNCDVFINNAHENFGQILLLIDLFKKWYNNSNKTIINIGSGITEVTVPAERYDLLNYQIEKISLKNTSLQFSVMGKCIVKYKSFGYVGTKKILEKYPHFTDKNYITENQAVDIILS
jgi:hypothetical protein